MNMWFLQTGIKRVFTTVNLVNQLILVKHRQSQNTYLITMSVFPEKNYSLRNKFQMSEIANRFFYILNTLK